MGTGMPCQWVNRQGREAELAPPSSAEIKNEWSYTSVSTSAFMSHTGAGLPFTVTLLTGARFLFFAVVPRHKPANLIQWFSCSLFPSSWSTQRTFNCFARDHRHWALSWTNNNSTEPLIASSQASIAHGDFWNVETIVNSFPDEDEIQIHSSSEKWWAVYSQRHTVHYHLILLKYAWSSYTTTCVVNCFVVHFSRYQYIFIAYDIRINRQLKFCLLLDVYLSVLHSVYGISYIQKKKGLIRF